MQPLVETPTFSCTLPRSHAAMQSGKQQYASAHVRQEPWPAISAFWPKMMQGQRQVMMQPPSAGSYATHGGTSSGRSS